MDDDRFDGLARSLQPLSDRRQTLRVVAASLLASRLSLAPGAGGAKKNKKKGKKHKKKKKPQPTCAQVCPGCSSCYHAIDGSVICGGISIQGCAPQWDCSSHSDCVGEPYPYCVRAKTSALFGTTTFICMDGTTGHCTGINPC